MKIVRAKVIVDHLVRFYLDDRTSVDRDFALLSGPAFSKIMHDPKLFKKIRVIDGHPVWPGDVDFCPDALLRGGQRRGRPEKFAIVGALGTLWSGRGVKSL